MPKLRVHNFAMSLDGYVAGPDQSLDNPLGVGGTQLHEWAFETASGRAMAGEDVPADAAKGIDDDFMARREDGVGATIMGRNMFGPIRGEWGESGGGEEWRGWWGPNPPYHHAVFVLTHHAHAPIEMEGGTTFHFVTDGIEAALARAVDAAGDADIVIGGGASTVRQFLMAGLIDWLHVPVVPVLLGGGERLFASFADYSGYRCADYVASPAVAHMVLERR